MSGARQVILDSDDEGSDFSPVQPAPDLDELFSSAVDLPGRHQDVSNENNSFRTTGTTDSSFFRKVYDEHNLTTHVQEQTGQGEQAHDLACKSGATAITSPASPQRQLRRQLEDFGTSITEPVSGSLKAKSHAALDLNFTQVTTPRQTMPGARDDPWEIPSSPVAGTDAAIGAALLRTVQKIAKRKRDPQPSPQPKPSAAKDNQGPEGLGVDKEPPETESEVAEILDTSSIPKGKKRKSNTPTSAQRPKDSSFRAESTVGLGDLAALQESRTSEEDVSNNVGSAYLYVSPPVLTASQRQEYEHIAVSSDPFQREDGISLPQLDQQELLHRSSCATTIAYATPSDFASSSAKVGSTSQPRPAKKRKLKSIFEEVVRHSDAEAHSPSDLANNLQPPSSPDILSEIPDASEKPWANPAHETLPAPEADMPRPSRSAKKKPVGSGAVDELGVHDDTWDSEAILPRQDKHASRTRRKRSGQHDAASERTVSPPHQHSRTGGAPLSTTDTWVLLEGSISSPQKGEGVAIAGEDLAVPEPNETNPPKRRGRKRGSGRQHPPDGDLAGEQQMDPQPDEPATLDVEVKSIELAAKRKRGRPRKPSRSKTPEMPDDVILAVDEKLSHLDQHDSAPQQTTEEPDVGDPNIATTVAPKKRGRKKKQQADETNGPQSEASNTTVLGTVSDNSTAAVETQKVEAASKAMEAEAQNEAKENQLLKDKPSDKGTKEPLKPTTPSQQPKMSYRVGLSKRSRIAPLLKSLRK